MPKSVTKGKIIRVVQEDGTKRYDFQFVNSRGFKTTMEGLSYKFDKEFWNYAKLISGVLRYGMPIDQVIKMISSLQMDSETINSWKVGVERALKKYIQDGTVVQGQVCPNCGQPLIFEEAENATVRSVIHDGFTINEGHPTFNKEWTKPVNAREFAKELIKHTYHNGYELPAMPEE